MGEDNSHPIPTDSVTPVAALAVNTKSHTKTILVSVSATIAVLALIAGAFYFGSHFNKPASTQQLQGGVAMTEGQLRKVVRDQNLTVYWTGPVPGYKYTLLAPKPGTAVVRYLPPGSNIADPSPTFRLVGTYVQKNAYYLATRAILDKANLGFLNIDGNAAYYVKTRPTNVFVGIKGKDIALEIFDPGSGQAVALALFKGQIQQIK